LNTTHHTGTIRVKTLFILLVFLILPIYSNTFHASFQFDDKPNIVDNTRLHITDLHPSTLWQTFFAKGGKDAFSRPISSLSLALNWYVGQGNTFGYHLVNVCIHILTTFSLYLTIQILLQTPRIRIQYENDDLVFIPALATVLWAVNPIQIQAVTYIVQRMASMAAMFSILAIYFYLKARLTHTSNRRRQYYLGCLGAFLLALMSKENAFLTLPSLVLVEIIFFQGTSGLIQVVRNHSRLLAVVAFIGLAILVFLIASGRLDFLVVGYRSRPFTLMERVLTQPRILLFYVSQIFYPIPDRLSITHDVVLSQSLLSPWTTMPAMGIIAAANIIALIQINKRPLMAFAILFFFLNHAIESTFLPLELVFEHRNYLPSLFIFLPIVSVLSGLIQSYKIRNRTLYALLSACVVMVVIGLGSLTYVRNRDWRTETTLWRDAMQKAPGDSRPSVNLAIQLAWGVNPTPLEYQVALTLFENAKSQFLAHKFLISDIYNNMGSIYYHMGQYQKAVETHKQGLVLDPGYLKMRYDLVSSLIMLGKWEEGAAQIDLLIDNRENYRDSDYFKLKGFILLWQQRPAEALVYFRKALQMEPGNRAVLLNTGVALSLLGKADQSAIFLKKAHKLAPTDMRPMLALIENAVRAGNLAEAEVYVQALFGQARLNAVIESIDRLSNNYRTAPMAAELIAPLIRKYLLSMPAEIDKRTAQIPFNTGPG
jgi:tetratricopeptide (TPR) repeat protein